MAVKSVTERDFGDLVKWIRQELSGSMRPITQERLSSLLGVSWSTVARWEGGQSPDPGTARKLSRLERAIELLGETVHPDDRLAFFEQRHPLLLNMRPIDLLETEEGTEALETLLEGVQTGAFQ